MKTLTVTKAGQMGDRDEKYGQAWWCEVAGQDVPVKFNLMGSDSVQEGDSLTAEEVLLKTSAKGTEYHLLKKVSVKAGDSPRLVTAEQVSNNDLKARVAKLEEAVFGEPADDAPPLDDKDAPIDMSDIPF